MYLFWIIQRSYQFKHVSRSVCLLVDQFDQHWQKQIFAWYLFLWIRDRIYYFDNVYQSVSVSWQICRASIVCFKTFDLYACYRCCPSFPDRPFAILSINFSHFHLILKNHQANFIQTLHKAFLDDGNSFCLNEGPHLFSREDKYEALKIHYPRFEIFPLRTTWPISTKLCGRTSNGPYVYTCKITLLFHGGYFEVICQCMSGKLIAEKEIVLFDDRKS